MTLKCSESKLASKRLYAIQLFSIIVLSVLLPPQANTDKCSICPQKCPQKALREINNLEAVLHQHNLYLTTNGRHGEMADLSYADLTEVDLSNRQLENANLKGTRLHRANLKGAVLDNANMTCTELHHAKLNGATLFKVDLRSAKLYYTNLKEAYLFEAMLDCAVLYRTTLQQANLGHASLMGSEVLEADLKDANFRDVILTGAVYQPANTPAKGRLGGLEGLETLKLSPKSPDLSGLLLLRKALFDIGLRQEEREVTYAIEKTRTQSLLNNDASNYFLNSLRTLHGWFRYLAFDWTVKYGLNPMRSFIWISIIWFTCSIVYLYFFLVGFGAPESNGVFRIFHTVKATPPRIGYFKRRDSIAAYSSYESKVVPKTFGSAVCWAMYFSLISTFRIGFREINLSIWIYRIQPEKFTLEGRGWLRSIAGVQSLFSNYLFVIWILSYFSRPFQ